ncbi:uncharacterized protein LOC143196019 [Rhynchophorus ferrugineus]|uniref:uncharacterized protein LOC143196019 n=1 Tax=Rhynchophorus ferrugineus TaxID=354439 RepID=UPI003FCD4B5C
MSSFARRLRHNGRHFDLKGFGQLRSDTVVICFSLNYRNVCAYGLVTEQLQKLGTDCSHSRLVMSSPRYQNRQRLVVEENKLPRRRTIDPTTASITEALSEK